MALIILYIMMIMTLAAQLSFSEKLVEELEEDLV
jgi:hypothetical protein